jgi:NAD(P)H dehydrogenase (quinone)
MPDTHPILVTGAGGGVGGVGRMVVEQLRAHGVPVRALVHHDDERAAALRAIGGVDVVVGDLTRGADVVAALAGCHRAYFGMSVSPVYLEAAATVASAARDDGHLELLVNMSQMTVSQMDLTSVAESRQQRLHWLAEQILNWSGLPVIHVRPTVFMENPLFGWVAVASIVRDGTIRLPFGSGRTSPVAAHDVAEVIARLLLAPSPPTGRVYELTGAESRDMTAIAAELPRDGTRPPWRAVDRVAGGVGRGGCRRTDAARRAAAAMARPEPRRDRVAPRRRMRVAHRERRPSRRPGHAQPPGRRGRAPAVDTGVHARRPADHPRVRRR